MLLAYIFIAGIINAKQIVERRIRTRVQIPHIFRQILPVHNVILFLHPLQFQTVRREKQHAPLQVRRCVVIIKLKNAILLRQGFINTNVIQFLPTVQSRVIVLSQILLSPVLALMASVVLAAYGIVIPQRDMHFLKNVQIKAWNLNVVLLMEGSMDV